VLKFEPAFARNLRRLRPRPADTWHLDEMVVSIRGRRMYLWRAIDSEGEILDLLVQPKRDKAAALRLMRKLNLRSARRGSFNHPCCGHDGQGRWRTATPGACRAGCETVKSFVQCVAW
jgi:hypothetical protein